MRAEVIYTVCGYNKKRTGKISRANEMPIETQSDKLTRSRCRIPGWYSDADLNY